MKEKGFTLIELVVVIVILGILAATALPKFMDIRSDAAKAAVAGVAGALSSASSVNYAGRLVQATNGVSINDCSLVSNALQGGLPAGYTAVTLAVPTTASNNTVSNCVLTASINGTGYSANFTAIGIS